MGENSKIEWTDHTFNPWWGCTHVHEGCRHCYAETWANRFGVKWGPNGVRRLCSEDVWRQPLKWNRKAEQLQQRARVFCASMADVFEDWSGPILDKSGEVWTKPYLQSEWDRNNWHTCDIETMKRDPQGWQYVTMDDVRRELFRLIDATPWLDWQLLTKRPENIERMWPERSVRTRDQIVDYMKATQGLCRANVWLGTSISAQESWYKQRGPLLECRPLAPVLFVSAEPLLGPVCDIVHGDGQDDIDWVICGGESGIKARPMDPRWVRSFRDQCQATNTSFFFKQWGEWLPHSQTQYFGGHFSLPRHKFDDDNLATRVGKQAAGRLLDGREWNEFPRIEVKL